MRGIICSLHSCWGTARPTLSTYSTLCILISVQHCHLRWCCPHDICSIVTLPETTMALAESAGSVTVQNLEHSVHQMANQDQSDLDADPSTQDNFCPPLNKEFYARSPYADLDTSVQDIRLLQLMIVNDDEPIRGRLVTTKLLYDNVPRQSYCAISYCAGSHND